MKQRLNKKLHDHYYRVFVRAINKAHKQGWRDERWPFCDLPWELNCCLSYNELTEDKLFRQHLLGSYLKRLDKIIKTHGDQLYKEWEKSYDKLMNTDNETEEISKKDKLKQALKERAKRSMRAVHFLINNFKRNLEERYKPIPEKDCIHIANWCDCKNCKKCGGTT